VQLNDARSGYHIWSQTYDRDVGDILTIQEEISSQIAHTIRPEHRVTLAATRSRDPETHKLYLLGRYQRNKTDLASVLKSIAFFQQAIDKDNGFAAAYSGLAGSYVKLAQQNSVPSLEIWALAQKAVDKALTLDDNLSESHTTQAIIYLTVDWNWEGAERQLRRAIALNSSDAAAHHWLSHYFTVMNQMSDSLAESETALKLDPLDLQISAHLISHYVRARDFSNAIKAGLQTLELDPHSRLAYLFLTWAYEDAAQWENAIDASQKTHLLYPPAAALRAALHAEGPRGYWRANQTFLARQENPDDYRLAVYYARLGRANDALASLEKAFQKRVPDLIYLKCEPAFDWMQGNPQFRALVKALKLP
jgi:Tfp pilus assembly protein PilF